MVDFTFSPEQEAFRAEVRQFIQRELPPGLHSSDDAYTDENFPRAMEFRRKLGRRKWIGIGWPKEYGGLGAGLMEQMVFHEEMVYHNAPLDGQAYQVGPALIAHGSDYLKKTYLAATANQDVVWAQGFSEPNAGSDLASLRTAAVRDRDDYVITGQKIWTSYAHRSDVIHVLARTDPNLPKHKGISYFVLDMRTPGITILPLIDMSGSHHFNQLFFDAVRVPQRNMIGERDQGWYVAMTTLEGERSGIRDVARVRRQLDDVFEAMAEMKGVAGLRTDPVMKHRLADLAVAASASRNLSYRVGWMQSRKMPIGREGSMAKMFATELWQRVCRVGMEMMGLYGHVMPESKHAVAHGYVSYHYLHTVKATISAGTSEVNRNIIAPRGLGLERG